ATNHCAQKADCFRSSQMVTPTSTSALSQQLMHVKYKMITTQQKQVLLLLVHYWKAVHSNWRHRQRITLSHRGRQRIKRLLANQFHPPEKSQSQSQMPTRG